METLEIGSSPAGSPPQLLRYQMGRRVRVLGFERDLMNRSRRGRNRSRLRAGRPDRRRSARPHPFAVFHERSAWIAALDCNDSFDLGMRESSRKDMVLLIYEHQEGRGSA